MFYSKTLDGHLQFALCLLELPELSASGKNVLCFEYDLQGRSGELAVLPSGQVRGGEAGYAAVSSSTEKHLHQTYLMGTTEQFEAMMRLVSNLLLPSETQALSHVDLLDLWDCVLDAEPRLRKALLMPLFNQARVVSHLQWAMDYLAIQQYEMVEEHLRMAERMLEKARQRPVPPVFGADTVDELWQVMHLIRGRSVRRTMTADNAAVVLPIAKLAFEQLADDLRHFELARTHYLAACRLEEGLIASAERLAHPTEDMLKDHFARVDERLEAAESEWASAPTRSGGHLDLLLAAIYLSRARMINTVSRLHQRRRRAPHVCEAAAQTQLDLAQTAAARCRGGALSQFCDLVEACISIERGNWPEADRTLRRVRDNEDDYVPAVRAAAAYNVSLLHCMGGRYERAAQEARIIRPLLPGYRADYFRRAMALCDPPLDVQETEELLRAVAAQEPEPDGNLDTRTRVRLAKWSSLIEAPASDGVSAAKSLLSATDILRDRRDTTARLDPLIVFKLLENLDDLVRGVYGHDHSPALLGARAGELAAGTWRSLGSRSRWEFYRETYCALTELRHMDGEPLWESVEREYRRHLFVPLRIIRYYSGGAPTRQPWMFVTDRQGHHSTNLYENDAVPEITHLCDLAERGGSSSSGTNALACELERLSQAGELPKALQKLVDMTLDKKNSRHVHLQALRGGRNARQHRSKDTPAREIRAAWVPIVTDLVKASGATPTNLPLDRHA